MGDERRGLVGVVERISHHGEAAARERASVEVLHLEAEHACRADLAVAADAAVAAAARARVAAVALVVIDAVSPGLSLPPQGPGAGERGRCGCNDPENPSHDRRT
jgi:hypothetical protein